MITDWDDAYANGAYISGADAIAAAWPVRSGAFRAKVAGQRLRYGDGPRQYIDLYSPDGPPKGLVVIVHGGYWQMLSGHDFAYLAEGAVARGFAVGMVTYTLAPEARIAEITRAVAQAVTLCADHVPGPVYLTGHSAGGHLVSRMGCDGVVPDRVAARLAHILSISGVHDLRPLLNTRMNEVLHLDAAEAAAESPALLSPRSGLRLTCVVGANERPEFLRQTDLLANVWTGLGAETRAIRLPGKHHFDVIDCLATPDGDLTRLLLDQDAS